jgi:nitroreductase
MTITESLQKRYACKKFDATKKVSDEKIEILKETFNLTPTSFGLQPIKLLIITNQELIDKIYQFSFLQEQVRTCSHLLIICIDTNVDSDYIDTYFDREKKIRGLTEEVVRDFRKELKEMYAAKTAEEIENSSIQQTYIVLGNLMTVCAVEEIDNCPIEGFIPVKVDELLDLKEKNLKSVLMLPVGVRAQDDIMQNMKKVRKPLSEMIIEI